MPPPRASVIKVAYACPVFFDNAAGHQSWLPLELIATHNRDWMFHTEDPKSEVFAVSLQPAAHVL